MSTTPDPAANIPVLVLSKPGTDTDKAFDWNNMLCANGVARMACNGFPSGAASGAVKSYLDPATNSWMLAANNSGNNTSRLVRLPITSDATADVVHDIKSFNGLLIRAFAVRMVGANQMLYACMSDGLIYKYDLTANQDLGALTYPVANMQCTVSQGMLFNGNWLTFAYTLNSLAGLAAFDNP